jgi:hypothetical protein
MSSSMRPTFGRQSTTDASSSDPQHDVVMQSVIIDDKGAAPAVAPAVGATGNAWDEALDKDAQLGVKKAQATTLSWSTKAMYTTLGWYVTCLHDAHLIRSSQNVIRSCGRTGLTLFSRQHLDLHSLRWFQSLDQCYHDSLCYQRVRSALSADCRRYCRKCDDGCVLHSSSKGPRSMGSC